MKFDFSPLVVLACVGIAVIVGAPLVGIGWLIWRAVR